MNSIASIALSGMNAASLSLNSAAHNIANLQTPGFRRQLTLQEAQPEGGVSVTLGRASEVGDAPIEDIVGAMVAGYAFKANLLTLQTHDRMLGGLLDVKA
jgi:flagellar hook protein FlgE